VPNISIGVRNGGTKPLSSDFIFLKLNQENIYVDFTDSHLQLHNFVATNRKNLAQTARLDYTFSVENIILIKDHSDYLKLDNRWLNFLLMRLLPNFRHNPKLW
jgi:hypothetical protein